MTFIKKREIVQIAGNELQRFYALCNDGTVWKFTHEANRCGKNWHLIENIPQDGFEPFGDSDPAEALEAENERLNAENEDLKAKNKNITSELERSSLAINELVNDIKKYLKR